MRERCGATPPVFPPDGLSPARFDWWTRLHVPRKSFLPELHHAGDTESMAARFLGFDHIDTRVPSIKAVEPFYDKLMSKLGLPRKRYAHVDAAGQWDDASDEKPYNTVEYYDEIEDGIIPHFIGFIEDTSMKPTFTRIAFRVLPPLKYPEWEEFLSSIGARRVERSASEEYPAIFFEDPEGTKLEICSRPRAGLL